MFIPETKKAPMCGPHLDYHSEPDPVNTEGGLRPYAGFKTMLRLSNRLGMIIKVGESHRGFELDPLEVRLRSTEFQSVRSLFDSRGGVLNPIKGLGPPWVSTGLG